jgi:hypothetical protein
MTTRNAYRLGPARTPPTTYGQQILAEIHELRGELQELRHELGGANQNIERLAETVNAIDAWVEQQ